MGEMGETAIIIRCVLRKRGVGFSLNSAQKGSLYDQGVAFEYRRHGERIDSFGDLDGARELLKLGALRRAARGR